jgi:hypothetical protein
MDEDTAALILEVVQGGRSIWGPEFLQAAQDLCRRRGPCSSLTRSKPASAEPGRCWLSTHGPTPDLCVSPSPGGRILMGPCSWGRRWRHSLPGHGSTFPRNPLACAAAWPNSGDVATICLARRRARALPLDQLRSIDHPEARGPRLGSTIGIELRHGRRCLAGDVGGASSPFPLADRASLASSPRDHGRADRPCSLREVLAGLCRNQTMPDPSPADIDRPVGIPSDGVGTEAATWLVGRMLELVSRKPIDESGNAVGRMGDGASAIPWAHRHGPGRHPRSPRWGPVARARDGRRQGSAGGLRRPALAWVEMKDDLHRRRGRR